MDTTEPAHPSRLLRAPTLLLALLVVGTSISLLWLVMPHYNARGDATIYILTSEALLAGEGYTYMGEPFVMRPPGFSLLLAPLLALVGENFLALNLFVSLFGVGAVALLFVYMRPRLGGGLAFVLALVVWANPEFRLESNQVQSDIPGLALMLGVLLIDRWARRGQSAAALRSRHLILGLALGLSCYVRSALLLLIPALLLARLFALGRRSRADRPWREVSLQALLLVAVPLLTLLPWTAWSGAQTPPTFSENTKSHSYGVAMWHADIGDPNSATLSPLEIVGRIPKRVRQILPLLGSRMREREISTANALQAAVFIAAWLAVLWRRRAALELFLGGYACTLLVYFGFTPRFVLVLVVFALANVAEVGLLLWGRILELRKARALMGTLLLALAAHDHEEYRWWPKAQLENQELEQLADYLNERFGPDEVLAATLGRHIELFSDRPVFTLKHAYARGGIDRVEEILTERRVSAVILEKVALAKYDLEQYCQTHLELEARVGAFTIYLVEPPTETVPAR